MMGQGCRTRRIRFLARLALGLGVLCAVLAQRQFALAQATGWLRVVGSDACLSDARLLAHTVRYLEGAAPIGEVQIEVRVAGEGASFIVEGEGQSVSRRAFDRLPEGCELRLSALGLAIALAVESVGAGRVIEPADTQPASQPAGQAEPTEGTSDAPLDPPSAGTGAGTGMGTEAEADSERSAGAALVWGVALGGGLVLGGQPAPAPTLSAGVDVAFGPWLMSLSGLWAPARELELDEFPTHRTRTELYGARLAACVSDGFGVVRAAVCLGVLGGALRARGVDFGDNLTATIPWLATAVGASVRVPADSALALRLRVDALQNLVQPALRVTGEGGGRVVVGELGLLGLVELHWSLR